MNNLNLREYSDLKPKEEGTNGGKSIISKPKLTTSSWTKLKDPRIVRVSRAFGGKDRHSKVCTVRGLRDRRVRLSVPTAIQLYDLQDRLGLNQPSKVVDWLLDVAKHEIDELPPLQMPLGLINNPSHQDFQSMINVASQSQSDHQGAKTNINWDDYWNPNSKSKEKDHYVLQPSNQSLSIFNNGVPNGSFLKLNPSTQFGSYGPMTTSTQEDASHNFNINVSGSQFLMYPPPTSHDQNSSSRAQFNNHQKQLNLEMLSSTTSSSSNSYNYPLSSSPLYSTINQGLIRPFNLSMNHKFFPSEENNEQDA